MANCFFHHGQSPQEQIYFLKSSFQQKKSLNLASPSRLSKLTKRAHELFYVRCMITDFRHFLLVSFSPTTCSDKFEIQRNMSRPSTTKLNIMLKGEQPLKIVFESFSPSHEQNFKFNNYCLQLALWVTFDLEVLPITYVGVKKLKFT